jgi:hypothetical protein
MPPIQYVVLESDDLISPRTTGYCHFHTATNYSPHLQAAQNAKTTQTATRLHSSVEPHPHRPQPYYPRALPGSSRASRTPSPPLPHSSALNSSTRSPAPQPLSPATTPVDPASTAHHRLCQPSHSAQHPVSKCAPRPLAPGLGPSMCRYGFRACKHRTRGVCDRTLLFDGGT